MDALLTNCSDGDFCPGYDCSSGPDLERVFFYDYGQEISDGFSLYNACNCSSFHKDTHRGVSLGGREIESDWRPGLVHLAGEVSVMKPQVSGFMRLIGLGVVPYT